MPELPEVQTIVNTLAPRLRGVKLVRVELRRPDVVKPLGAALVQLIEKRTVRQIHRRAKRIVFSMDDGVQFYIHLGMTGRLIIIEPDGPIAKHTHLILHAEQFQVHFSDPRRFGGIFLLSRKCDENLGPEPLEIRSATLGKALARTSRAIKNALLDQTVIAGLGNIYVDEALHAAGIHPLTPAKQLEPKQVAVLLTSIKKVLKKALKHRGSTLRDYVDASGGKGAFQKLHRVYDRANLPCRSCKTKIVRIVLGGRSTCFCPECQPTRG